MVIKAASYFLSGCEMQSLCVLVAFDFLWRDLQFFWWTCLNTWLVFPLEDLSVHLRSALLLLCQMRYGEALFWVCLHRDWNASVTWIFMSFWSWDLGAIISPTMFSVLLVCTLILCLNWVFVNLVSRLCDLVLYIMFTTYFLCFLKCLTFFLLLYLLFC